MKFFGVIWDRYLPRYLKVTSSLQKDRKIKNTK